METQEKSEVKCRREVKRRNRRRGEEWSGEIREDDGEENMRERKDNVDQHLESKLIIDKRQLFFFILFFYFEQFDKK